MLHLARYSSVTPADFEKALGITVGFDSMFDRLFGDIQRTETASGFPPYNIRKDEDEKYTIEMAVAGFSQEDLEVELKFFKIEPPPTPTFEAKMPVIAAAHCGGPKPTLKNPNTMKLFCVLW